MPKEKHAGKLAICSKRRKGGEIIHLTRTCTTVMERRLLQRGKKKRGKNVVPTKQRNGLNQVADPWGGKRMTIREKIFGALMYINTRSVFWAWTGGGGRGRGGNGPTRQKHKGRTAPKNCLRNLGT